MTCGILKAIGAAGWKGSAWLARLDYSIEVNIRVTGGCMELWRVRGSYIGVREVDSICGVAQSYGELHWVNWLWQNSQA